MRPLHLPSESPATGSPPTASPPAELLVLSTGSTATLPSLESEGFRVWDLRDCRQALQVVAERKFDAVLVSTNCQHQSEFLNRLHTIDAALQVLVLRESSGDERIGSGREFDDLPNLHVASGSTPVIELRRGLRQAAELTRLRRENILLRQQLKSAIQGSKLNDVSDRSQQYSDQQAPPFSIGNAIDLATITRAHVLAVLNEHGGNKARAARALGINRRSLYRLLEKYDEPRATNSRSTVSDYPLGN